MAKEAKKNKSQNKPDNSTHPVLKLPRTFGQTAADNLTNWAGSWIFIIGFMTFLVLWIGINAYILVIYNRGDPFDPYPFILLNLVLSCLAAIQAPIILMSQNREAQKDRQKSNYDYAVNRKAEREIQDVKTQLDRIERKLNRK